MDRRSNLFYEFGPFRLDVSERCLLRGARRVGIKPKVFTLLLALIQNSGRVLTKEELITEVWQGYFVGEHNLDVTVHALRRVLGEKRGERHYIETVPRRGYRFIAAVAERRTQNSEAHQAYLKGRYFLGKRTPEAFSKSIEFFARAVKADGEYAQAYAGLADAYKLLHNYNASPPKEYTLHAKAAAVKALELDDGLAEAHVSLALIKYRHDWDWAGAESEFKRALELNPNDATAHHMYGMYLTAVGRFHEASTELQRAQEIDPLSLIISSAMGAVFYFAGEYERAQDQLNETLELDADFGVARYFLARTYEQKRMYSEAIAEYDQLIRRAGDTPVLLVGLGYTHALSGKKNEARKVLAKLGMISGVQYVPPVFIALMHTGLGRKSLALTWLETAYEERDEELGLIKVDPRLESLRSSPRFKNLLRRIGLSE
jgi:DNA-binding winged helix-turn-helix (wHTH) protein/Tfp pilus assembly protein PilF